MIGCESGSAHELKQAFLKVAEIPRKKGEWDYMSTW